MKRPLRFTGGVAQRWPYKTLASVFPRVRVRGRTDGPNRSKRLIWLGFPTSSNLIPDLPGQFGSMSPVTLCPPVCVVPV